MTTIQSLPPDIHVFERGWLSANNILLHSEDGAALVDSGYATHAEQTLALVDNALAGQTLKLLVNTHLHSDHCGGNAALQARYPALRTLIPPGEAQAVRAWDEERLSYKLTGQTCPRFGFDALLQPGSEFRHGQRCWQVHAAPGHDPHSVLLFEPALRLLISADALWQNGFGVVFPEIEGVRAFEAVGATLDLIESLQPQIVIPGHGPVFTDVGSALSVARRRLQQFVDDPTRHARYAAKALLKFKLLEWQQISLADLLRWSTQTPIFSLLHRANQTGLVFSTWVEKLLADLQQSGAASMQEEPSGTIVINR